MQRIILLLNLVTHYFSHVSNCLDAFSFTYNRFLLVGDINAEDFKETLSNLLDKHNTANVKKGQNCSKSLDNPSWNDLSITNWLRRFQNTTVFFTGLPDFHKWLLLSWKHLSVKHLQKKCFTEITKTLSKINSNINWKIDFKMNQLNVTMNLKRFFGYTKLTGSL